MNELIVKDNIKIEDLIFEIRGKQVMFASDVAKLYGEETRRVNEIVKRNINRFPENFCFKLTKDEYKNLRSQIAISNERNYYYHGGSRYLPFVFTEHGIMMLSGLLKSDIAARVNISIINAFISMKKFISNELLEQKYVNNLVFKHEEDIKLLQNSFTKFKSFSNELFFEGQIYDAYSLLLDIFNLSKNKVTIIDNYISKELLDVLSKINKEITIYTKNIDEILINKYQSQYNNIVIKINNSFHDRFIIIDDDILYHCGASFKGLGKKSFAINKIDNKDFLNNVNLLLNKKR